MAIDNDPQLYSSGYERNRLDRYWTHPWMTNELLNNQEISKTVFGPVWECAAGRGDMSRAIAEHDLEVYSTDIDISEFDTRIGPSHEKSFLDETELPQINGDICHAIITNPPYNEPWRGISNDFIRHGLSFFDKGAVFMAMLMRSEYKSGKSRADMFGHCPHYLGELVLTTRPRWDYGDPDAPETAAPRHNFSWFIWRKNYRVDSKNNMTFSSRQWFSYMPKGFKT